MTNWEKRFCRECDDYFPTNAGFILCENLAAHGKFVGESKRIYIRMVSHPDQRACRHFREKQNREEGMDVHLDWGDKTGDTDKVMVLAIRIGNKKFHFQEDGGALFIRKVTDDPSDQISILPGSANTLRLK